MIVCAFSAGDGSVPLGGMAAAALAAALASRAACPSSLKVIVESSQDTSRILLFRPFLLAFSSSADLLVMLSFLYCLPISDGVGPLLCKAGTEF